MHHHRETAFSPSSVIGIGVVLLMTGACATTVQAPTAELDGARGAIAAASSERTAKESAELKRQIDELQAQATSRELILTQGDVLFTTGKSDLRGASTAALDKLVVFLKQYEARAVAIEGHTDSMGPGSANQLLSERRANAVRAYLVRAGIASSRLTVTGLGETQPIADNGSGAGRQENRRVVLVISDPAPIVVPIAAQQIPGSG